LGKTMQKTISDPVSLGWSDSHPLFRTRKVTEDIWAIRERYFESSINYANLFFFQGTTADLLLDTGVGIHELPPFLSSSGLRPDSEKPLNVVITHMHFDHSGGGHQFKEVYAHTEEVRALEAGDSILCCPWVTDDEVQPKPFNWTGRGYCVKPCKVTGVADGHLFDLGSRKLEVLHLPGHTPGSIGLWEPLSGILATGDTLFPTAGPLIDWYPGSNCKQMAGSVQRLKRLAVTGKVKLVLPGHGETGGWEIVEDVTTRYLDSQGSTYRMKRAVERMRTDAILRAHAKGLKAVDRWKDV